MAYAAPVVVIVCPFNLFVPSVPFLLSPGIEKEAQLLQQREEMLRKRREQKEKKESDAKAALQAEVHDLDAYLGCVTWMCDLDV